MSGTTPTPPTSYVEKSLYTIWNAANGPDYEHAFNAFFSADVQVTVNGQKMAREQLHALFMTEDTEGGSHTANVTFRDTLATALIPDPSRGSVVAVFVTVDFQGRCLVSSPSTSKLTASINLELREEDEFRLPGVDLRRAFALNMIAVHLHNDAITAATVQ